MEPISSPRLDLPEDANLEALEIKIAKLLRYGVLISGALLLTGWLTSLKGGGNPFTAFAHYQPVPLLESLGQTVQAGDWPKLASYAGLLVLISLPILRVLATAVLFLRQRDWMLAAFAGFVLFAILLSCALGFEL